MSWCGFIDLLGTKESANASVTKLKIALGAFHHSLNRNFHLLGDGMCFAFSDGAFFQTNKLKDFIAFYQEVRGDLFSNANYFKCAIIKGKLEADTALAHDQSITSLKSGFWSVRFGDSAAKAFMDQDLFKGIGAIFSNSDDENSTPLEFVDSFYFSSDRTTSIKPYKDVRYRREEVGARDLADKYEDEFDEPVDDQHASSSAFIHSFFREASIAKARSNKYARYYIPAIASMIRSQDFADLDYLNGRWENTTILFDELFLNNSISKEFSRVPGFHFLYWALIDEVWKQKPRDMATKMKEALIMKLSSKRATFVDVGQIPSFVVSPPVREEALSLKATLDMQIRGGRKQ